MTDIAARERRSLSIFHWTGREVVRLLGGFRGMLSLGLITLSVLLTQRRRASKVISPLIWREVLRSGVRPVPIVLFLSSLLGLAVIGQTVVFTTRLGAQDYLGTVMVMVVVRELGPMLAALVVLVRAGSESVIELGSARASHEIEAMEAIGIDPIHYWVVPRVLGMALGVFCLTVYAIVAAVLSGYLWAFLQNIPILPGDYFGQLARALHPLDFLALGLKSGILGVTLALLLCYHGLAQPIRREDIPRAAIRALTQGVVLCVLIDAVFLALSRISLDSP